MKEMERRVVDVEDGMAETNLQQHKEWESIDKQLGFPGGKKIYRCLAGPNDMNTFVWEREWESFDRGALVSDVIAFPDTNAAK
jgi:hypothetical protein